ncbi:Amino acid transporter [Trichuris trichiura]|uniref:Amino acid transporter n=1 Tax=Trichuris trichiura TaxID=36087 RepID=A0A077ZJL8_TRITR|nr:Amino acid transporter [Trichuris trichiura]
MVSFTGSYSPQEAQNAVEQHTLVAYERDDLSLCKATAALIRSMLGPVIFTFPSLYQKTGFLPGLLLTLASATWSTCTMMMIAKASDCICQTGGKEATAETYGHLCGTALKKTTIYRETICQRISRLLNYAVAAFQIGTCCFQVKFMTTHTSFLAKMVNCTYCPETSYCHLIILPCVCIVGTITNLTTLARLALLANGLVAVVIVVVVVQAAASKVAGLQLPSLNGHADFATLLQTFGAIIFAFEAHTLILPLRNRMHQPRKLASPMGVVPLSMLTTATAFVTVGSMGFFALNGRSPESILLSDQVITHKWIQAAVIGIMIFAVMASYPFNLLAVIDILEDLWNVTIKGWSKKVKKLPLTFLLRLLLSLLIGALAMPVSNLESITSFLGGSVGMLICFIVPPLTLLPLELERNTSPSSTSLSTHKKRLLTTLRVTQSFIGIAVACFILTAKVASKVGGR